MKILVDNPPAFSSVYKFEFDQNAYSIDRVFSIYDSLLGVLIEGSRGAHPKSVWRSTILVGRHILTDWDDDVDAYWMQKSEMLLLPRSFAQGEGPEAAHPSRQKSFGITSS